jgi:hypothetical protein
MSPVYETKDKVKFVLHCSSECVAKKKFHLSEIEVSAQIEDFSRKVYGNKRIKIYTYKDSFLPKLRNKCEVMFVKFCQKLRLLW